MHKTVFGSRTRGLLAKEGGRELTAADEARISKRLDKALSRDRFTTAVHEAGHAVAHIHFGIPFTEVRINDKEEGSVGGYLCTSFEGSPHEEIQTLLAGMLAQRNYDPEGAEWSCHRTFLLPRWYVGGGSDFEQIAAILNAQPLVQLLLRLYPALVKETRQFVTDHWRNILKVARALHRERYLSFEQVKGMIEPSV